MDFGQMTVEPTNRRRKSKRPDDIKLDGEHLEEITCYKYFGVKLDHELNFKQHVNSIIKNVAGKISNMQKMR